MTKALKWKQQQNNPSILLRGYNLRSADTWLKVARTRTQHPPISLQEEFINESLRQPPLESLDVFISYSRGDSDFARKLNDALQIQGKTTWFDQESIASGSNFQEEIYRGIKACDNFLFILSPRSINSPYCKDEVEYAASLNKRFITLLHHQIETSELHPELAQVQWIDFNSSQRDFNSNFNQLLRTIDTDRDHVHSHSKWSQRALEWEEKDKTDDLLLRGNEFLLALNWLEESEGQKKKPATSVVQKAFIQASQKAIEMEAAAEKRRQAEMLRLQEEKTKQAEARLKQEKKNARLQKFFLIAISIGLVAAVGLAGWAIRQRKIADRAREAQLDSVSRFSLQLSEDNLNFDALLEAMSAGSQLQNIGKPANSKLKSEILTALQQAVYGDWFREQNRLTSHKGTVFDGAWSPDGKTIATVGGDAELKLWNLKGEEIKDIQVGNSDNEVYSVSFSPDGKLI
ncbi:MAG: TIR domain-containing protein, partial [Cyanobacteria bacterium J06649_11]